MNLDSKNEIQASKISSIQAFIHTASKRNSKDVSLGCLQQLDHINTSLEMTVIDCD